MTFIFEESSKRGGFHKVLYTHPSLTPASPRSNRLTDQCRVGRRLDPVAGGIINRGDLLRIDIIADCLDLFGKCAGERVPDVPEADDADGGSDEIWSAHLLNHTSPEILAKRRVKGFDLHAKLR